jgi:hypothetical protein
MQNEKLENAERDFYIQHSAFFIVSEENGAGAGT